MTEIQNRAIEKIQAEFKEFKGGAKEKAVSSYVSNVLQDACKQDERFADVLLNFKQTLSDCLTDIMKNVGDAISDIDVYRRAAQFYFPNSDIEMTMRIEITGDKPDKSVINKEPEKTKKAEPNPKKAADNKPKSKSKKKAESDYIQISF